MYENESNSGKFAYLKIECELRKLFYHNISKHLCVNILIISSFNIVISWPEQVNYQCKNDAVHFELDQHA
jgi:hypothetical protein